MIGCEQGYFRWGRGFLLLLSFLLLVGLHRTFAAPNLAAIKAAAEAGNAQAQDKLAEAYRRQHDHANKVYWYRKAAAQGVPNSQYQLGEILIHEATNPSTRSPSHVANTAKAREGVEFLSRAAQQDHKRAQLHLGRLHQEGKLVTQDYAEAYKWFAIAGKGGQLDPPSMEGRMYRDRLILKMSQAQITKGEVQAKAFRPGLASGSAQPAYLKNLKLQGISGTQQRRLAIINGQTFEAGEKGYVKVGNTRVAIKCLAVTDHSAWINVEVLSKPVELKLGEELAIESNAPLKQVASTHAIPKPAERAPVLQQSSADQVPQVQNPLDAFTSLVRKAAWLAAGVLGFLLLAVLDLATVVPLSYKASKRRAQARGGVVAQASPRRDKSANTVATVGRNVSETNLMKQLLSIDWFQFEKVVGIVFRKRGYVVESGGGANPDGGIDLFIQKDGQRQAIQCKHWKKADVGVTTVREFLGAMKDAGVEQGMFSTLR